MFLIPCCAFIIKLNPATINSRFTLCKLEVEENVFQLDWGWGWAEPSPVSAFSFNCENPTSSVLWLLLLGPALNSFAQLCLALKKKCKETGQNSHFPRENNEMIPSLFFWEKPNRSRQNGAWCSTSLEMLAWKMNF